jgi:S-adenosylmethionine:tRNA ribosyltransferase-isomerase
MNLADFDYNLPPSLIAQSPQKPRDHSRLLVLDKNSGQITHRKFFDIVDYLQAGDVLVLNSSKVIPARLLGRKETGGELEIFLSKRISNIQNQENDRGKEIWECLIKGKVRAGMLIDFDNDLRAIILSGNNDGANQLWQVEFNKTDHEFMTAVAQIGQVPLPPYIKKELTEQDREDYQTIYADDNHKGSVAAPTAGFHFTNELLQQLIAKGVIIQYLTLHVGLGTFLPVKTNDITEHKMHAEWVEIKKEVIETINQAKQNHKKIIAVGTTSCRSLEAAWQTKQGKNQTGKDLINENKDFNAWVDIFIYPGYEFKVVDALITNFHLPKSTLIMLVSALAGKEYVSAAYQIAVEQKYRFYSYGDAMLIV